MNRRDSKTSWKPIEDYLVSPDTLKNPELKSLAGVWKEQRGMLEKNNAIEVFQEKLCREWAIETGLIERLYTLDRGVTQMLIEHGIDAALIPHSGGQDATHVADMIGDQKNVVEGLFSFVKDERTLSTSYIKELHVELTQHQEKTTAINGLGRRVDVDLIRGDFKKQPNNPTRPDGTTHMYCPPEQVESEMSNLIDLHLSHDHVATEVEAAWVHHRFTQIHPFQDGNGRVARCLATLIFLKAGWFPLVIRNKERAPYIDALECADQGDLASLINMFSAIQKGAFIKALSLARDARDRNLGAVISAVAQDLKEKTKLELEKWKKAKSIAAEMNDVADKRFADIIRDLKRQTSEVRPQPRFHRYSASDKDKTSYYFHRQIVETAKKMNYYANTREFRAWTHLVMHLNEQDEQADILISFHGIGYQFRGVLVASACFFQRSQTGEDERETSESIPLSDEVFQINYLESSEDVRKRFDPWLDDVLAFGLETWRRGLAAR